jgi:hypothetical protein
MKRISDLLKNKKKGLILRGVSPEATFDEKTIEKVFIEIAARKIFGIEAGEIKEVRFKDNKLNIRTAHPIIAGELWKRRRVLIKEVNEILRRELIKEIKVY